MATIIHTDHLMCLSIRQPFCEEILTGVKQAEYRSWNTKHRGPLLIHASKSTAESGSKDLPRGVIVGLVDVAEVVHYYDDIGGVGDLYAWCLRNPSRFVRPVPFVGKVGLFRVPISLVQDCLILPGKTGCDYRTWSRSIPTA